MSGLNGDALNGHATSGHATNGHALNGHALNGTSHLGTALGPTATVQDLPMEVSWSDMTWSATDGAEPVSEQARLTAEIEAATNRAIAARSRMAAREAEVQAVLRDEVAASRALLEDLKRQHIAAIELVREASQAEVARILADARERAAGLDAPPRAEQLRTEAQGAAGDR